MKNRRGGARFTSSWFGCMSQSAVAVPDPLEKKQLPQAALAQPPSSSPITTITPGRRSISGKRRRSITAGGDAGGVSKGMKAKSAAAAAAASGIVAAGVHGLVKGFKSLSQMFRPYDDGEEEEEEEEEEREIKIGYPTDVKHIGYIGWDRMTGGMVSTFNMPSPPLDPSTPWTPPLPPRPQRAYACTN